MVSPKELTVAATQPIKKKVRIRKTAPTVRERAAEAQAKARRPSRFKFLAAVLSVFRNVSRWPFRQLRKLKLPDNRFSRLLKKIVKPVFSVLKWVIPSYFINSWREVKLVTWPSRRETWKLTSAVFVFAIVFGVSVAGVDYSLEYLFKKLILK